MRRTFVRFFNNLPIERKLLLASVIPLVALAVLSVMTYQSARTFADNEEHLNRVYLTQRTAAEFLRLAVDLESGFRGYVVARQDGYLEPYRVAHDHILLVGDNLESMVHNHAPQRAAVQEVQRLMKRLISEKDRLIQSVRQGRSA